MGFRLNPKWVFPVQSHFVTHSNSRFHSVRRGEACFSSPRFPSMPLSSEESLVFLKDHLGAYSSTFLGTIENEYSIIKYGKSNAGKRSPKTKDIMSYVTNACTMDDKYSSATTHTPLKESSFGLLLDNLGELEETFVDLDVVRLEEDIKFQLRRLGALKLFNICLSQTLQSSSSADLSNVVPRHGDINPNVSMDTYLPSNKVFIRSKRKNDRKRRREVENLNTDSVPLLPPRSSQRCVKHSTASSMKRSSRSRYRRSMIAKNEVEMAKGVKMLASFERVRETLEKETGKVVSLCCWAEAAGVDEKMLCQNLHFAWHCRDALLRSTRSLVLFLARNYRGLGIANEDLLQAGNLGVLHWADVCLRVVGSFDQKIGDSIGAKYLELMLDMSVESPEDFVLKQQLKREIDTNILAGLDCRERQVIALRYGLKDLQPKSLDEIGRLVHVSKEWVREIEKKAMTKLKSSEKCASLKHYSVL